MKYRNLHILNTSNFRTRKYGKMISALEKTVQGKMESYALEKQYEHFAAIGNRK